MQGMKEYNKIKNFNYREYCSYLQTKYGLPTNDYFAMTGADNHLTQKKVSRGKEGLQCHHICEDIVPGLSAKFAAENNPIEYQAKENLCYCNLLEHAWLHILITENNTTVSDEDQDYITGQGGVRWMLLALNSIFCDAATSWYSSKNEEGKGCNYNVNNIITDNYDVYLKVINRYCTSAFIRQRLNKQPRELAESICITTKKDINTKKRIADIIAAGTDTKLFDWNVNAYADLENFLKANRTALIWICTGGGKTTTALEYLRVHNARALILGPSNTIGDGWGKQNEAKITYKNYQTFMNIYASLDYSKYDVVICDEVHHAGAPRWGEGLKYILDNTSLKIIGLTATPNSRQFRTTDNYFGGRICNGLELADGIKEKIIWPFSYIQSIYKMSDVKDEFLKYGDTGTLLWNRLNLIANQNPIEKILKDNMPKGVRKIIVFVSRKADMPTAINTIKKYDPDLEIKEIYSGMDTAEVARRRNWFNDTSDHSVCLVTVSMVNEGAHYAGVNTLIMFRRTDSATLFLQQLGRIVTLTKKANPKSIVFDFTNNAQNLIYNTKVDIYDEITTTDEETKKRMRALQEILRNLGGNEVIYKDYTEDCVATLNALNDVCKTSYRDSAICEALIKATDNIEIDLSELLDIDAWKGFKTKTPSGTFPKMNRPTSNKTKESFKDILPLLKRANTYSTSDAERLANAFMLVLKRAYTFGYITFKDDHSNEIVIKNKTALDQVAKQFKFKDSMITMKAAEILGMKSFLLSQLFE